MRRLHAENQFVIGIIQRERGAQRLLAEGLQPAQRPHQRDGRRRRRAGRLRGRARHLRAVTNIAEKLRTRRSEAPGGAKIGDNRHMRLSSGLIALRLGAVGVEIPRRSRRLAAAKSFFLRAPAPAKRRPGRGRLNIPPDICAPSWQKGAGAGLDVPPGTLPNLVLKLAHDNSNRPICAFADWPHPYRQRASGAVQLSVRVEHHGRFVLRFDDTDFARSTAAFAQEIEIDLAWLGVVPD